MQAREQQKETRVAIVGMAFRFPGDLNDEATLWQALKGGKHAVGQIGPERWAVNEFGHPRRSEPGRSITFAAGVLSRIDEFDADFFGISPREAAWLDPQQRLLLELAWEAIENSGHLPSSLAGSDCAVYVGISGFDYGVRGLDDLSSITAHTMTGNTLSIAANRLSYVLDLRGPSLAIDTACSSSLVALHHACNSVRAGEASMALVGGVNLLLHPYPFIGFTKASMLSANDRCRAFDASGDGYVRAEGGAVLLLKPYEKAIADGDDIQAVILASGVNADGSRKTGMTIPSSEGQAVLMRCVLERSGLSPLDIDFIEAHGTGTAVGDPVETAAIGAVYGHGRPAGQPLPIGSVKTNLGHLEPASGMAGLVKTVLALKNRALPPSLNHVTPNPKIDFGKLNLEVVTACRPLAKAKRRPLVAGVNSFGFGGANAHVLLQEYRSKEAPHRADDLPVPPLFLSARTAPALREVAARYGELLSSRAGGDYYDVAYAAAYRRERLEKRFALKVADAKEAKECLTRFVNGELVAGAVLEDELPEAGGLAFIYSGNGAQWIGMARRLLQESPRFAKLFAALETPIQARSGFSILVELHADEPYSRLADTAVAQPLLFAIQVALTTILREQGVEPVAVAGHSVGEVAAAWAAGLLDLEQAIEVICARSAAQALTCGAGRMAAVGLSEAGMADLLRAENCRNVEIAGINSPDNITIAGPLDDLEHLRKILKARGVIFKLLDLEYAFHSRSMDRIKDTLLDSLAGLKANPPCSISFVSTVTGDLLEGSALDACYWWQNVRQPVRFASAMSRLAELGCRVFIEIGPHAIVQRYMGECLSAKSVTGRVMPTLRKGHDGRDRIEEVVLRAHLLCDSMRREVFFSVPGRRVRLPNYPWQRERHWLPTTSEGHGLIERRRVHPLLGWRLTETESAWENVLDPATLGWLVDHKVGGAIVLPGAAYVEMALAAASEWFGGESFELEELDIVAPIVFDGEHGRSVRLEFSPRDGGFQIRSRQRLSEDEWALNACGRLLGAPVGPVASNSTIDAVGSLSTVDRSTHYRLAAAIGLEYGPIFQGLESARVQGDTLLATLDVPDSLRGVEAEYFLHPAALDVCFQSLVDFFKADIEEGRGVPLLPVKVGRLRLYGKATVRQFRVSIKKRSARSVLADFDLLDSAGNIVAVLSACRFRAAALQRRNHAAPALWRIEPRLIPHPLEQGSVMLPANLKLAKQLRAWFADEEGWLQRATYFQEAFPLSEALVISFAYAAFQELFSARGEWLQRVLAGEIRVGDPSGPLFRWLSECLRQEGLLIEDGGKWRLELTDIPLPDEIWRTLLRDYPACLPELVSVGRIGRNLPALLTGEADGHSFLRQLRLSHPCETLYDDSPAYQGARLAIQQTLRGLAAGWPGNRRLRVLEIAGGASELPRQLGELMPSDRIDYVLAHSDEEVCARLRAEYHDHPFTIVANVNEDGLELAAERSLPDCFDVIVLRHWIHEARNQRVALTAAGRKLASGGLLLLAERHPDLSAVFVNGIDPDWWYAGEGLKPVSRLQSPTAWKQLLAEQGFEDVEALVEPTGEELSGGGYLVLAKKSADAVIAAAAPAVRTWLLLADADGPSRSLAEHLIRHLESHGQRVAMAIARPDEEEGLLAFQPHDRESVERVVATARQRLSSLDHIVHLNGLGASDPDTAGQCAGLLHLVRELAGSHADCPQLWLVTAGGVLTADTAASAKIDPSQAALWAFARVIMNEYPALSCRLIDIACLPVGGESAARLATELLWPDGEDEIILSAAGRYGLRMESGGLASNKVAASEAQRFRLDFHVPGQLRNLVWLSMPERPLADDEIEVRTQAAGLNFRDVMYLMGLLPDEAVENGFAGASLGLEFSGIVTRTGARVRDLVPGDAVMGFGSACFASHVVTTASAVARKPEEWSFETAATVPTVFFTVYYALTHLANLQPGERVLIHGAAGGVGIAAVQLARYLGAEVFATAGSSEKRDFVHLLGADHVLDSRSLAFADEILALTNGEGVDVVLNSLAGEAIRRNLRVLKPFGRFLELGKRDFFENTPIGLRPFKDNISYFGIDADQLLIARPDLAARLFREVMGLFREGVLSPLPCRVFPAERVVDAFRVMQQARHIGKVVVTLDKAPGAVEQSRSTAPATRFRKDATYLVTGGLSGFGLESARWLAERGAGNLVLLSRRGLQTPGAAEAVAELALLGVRVEVMACDVAERSTLEQVLAEVRRNLPPLRGVLHAAMVLDDALIANLDPGRFGNVLAPKVLGAKHLHDLTLDIPLDHFILYSSVTTFIGNPGQANYVAANGYLEGLAALRRGLGLPATCVGWGPLGDAGYLTRNETVKESLSARLGAASLTSKNALAMLDRLLATQAPTCAVADFEWQALARLLPSAQGPRFADLRRLAGAGGAVAQNSEDFESQIAGKSVAEVREVVRTLVAQEVAQILCIGVDRIDPARSLHDLGMDSLMGVELALALEKRCGIHLPAMMLNEGPTVERVAARIVEKVIGEQPTDGADEDRRLNDLVSMLAAQHGETLSADDLAMTADSVQQLSKAGTSLIL